MHSDPSNAIENRNSAPEATLRELPPRPPPNPQSDPPFSRIDWPQLCQHLLHLTPRQSQIVQLIVEQDLTSTALGQRLGISERTVTTHIANIEHRLNVRSRSGIVSRAWAAWLQIVADDAAQNPEPD